MGWFGSSGSSDDDTSGRARSSGSTYLNKDELTMDEGFVSKRRGTSLESASLGTEEQHLQVELQMHQQQMQINAAVHRLTSLCFDLCDPSVSSSLGSRSEQCLINCSNRFVDVTLLVTNRFAQLAQRMQR